MQDRDRLDDRQAQAAAAGVAAGDPVEAVQHPLAFVGRDAGPAVVHAQQRGAVHAGDLQVHGTPRRGEWEAYSYYVGSDYRADWAAADTWVESSYATCDTLYLETVESYTVESWEVTMELDVDVDFAVSDIADADLAAGDAYLESSYSYDELSSESYSEEFATAGQTGFWD